MSTTTAPPSPFIAKMIERIGMTTDEARFLAVSTNNGTHVHRANCSDLKKYDHIIGFGSTPEGAAIDSYSDFIMNGDCDEMIEPGDEMTEADAISQCRFNPCSSDGKG
jgi:hypothetical protein